MQQSVDLRLEPDSPALDAGIYLPADGLAPLRLKNDARPNIDAVPAGSEPLKVGIDARTVAGAVQ
jgi:hypothetical protein